MGLQGGTEHGWMASQRGLPRGSCALPLTKLPQRCGTCAAYGVIMKLGLGKHTFLMPALMHTQISFLEEVGIPSQQVCNMASRVPRILGLSTEQLQAVVAYLKDKGLGGALCLHPFPVHWSHAVAVHAQACML